MGSAGGSLDDCEEQVKFWRIWNEATGDEKHRLGVLIGKKTNDLLKSSLSAADVRQELARFVRTVILKASARRGSSRKRRR